MQNGSYIKYTAFSKNQNVKEGIEALYRSSERFSSFLHEEYSNRVNVLRDLGFIDSSDIVTLKGRVAIEVISETVSLHSYLLGVPITKSIIFLDKACFSISTN